MKSLRVQVERVVRPLRASNLRKDRMREELLLHLSRLFDEELARTGDAQSATSKAIARFGDASLLARELQASVPWFERWNFLSLPNGGPICRRPNESPVRYIVRMNCWAGAWGATFYALMALVIIIFGGSRAHRVDQPTAVPILVSCMGLAAIQFTGLTALGLLSEGIRQELNSRASAEIAVERRIATWRIIYYAFAGAALWGCSFAGVLLLIEFAVSPFLSAAQFWCVTVGATAFGLLMTLRQAWHWKALVQRFENWDSLDLGEQPTT